VQLILRQLALDPDNGCEPLGKQGARGALFKLTLDSYGYTFVAKGTVGQFKANLKHEYESAIWYLSFLDIQRRQIIMFTVQITRVKRHIEVALIVCTLHDLVGGKVDGVPTVRFPQGR
jgi:hypothetical protein